METKVLHFSLRKALTVLLACFILAALVPLLYVLHWPLAQPPQGQTADIRIKFGTPPDSIAVMLERAQVIGSANRFKLALKLLNKGGALRAGHFRIPRPVSNKRAILALTEGPQILTKVTIPEGLTVQRIAGIFRREMGLDSSRIVQLTRDSSFTARFRIGADNLEGYLLPETYFFPYGSTETQVITPLVQQFKRTVWDTLYARSQEMGFTTGEMLTLASIIQAEAKREDEMPAISSVYHNRLRLGIPLQADPTIQYLLPDGPRHLLFRDLEIDSPYNTYRHRGLPPGPIANPGKAAILAAVRPEATDYLFFVADTYGGHTFSSNYRGHLKAKTVLDQERKRVKAMRR
ncbi:MAG TPA: endolytic transglycosylase MltG [bacterium]|mgnify:CR=1 FL=1|nr:endolytic transglycosylase MltG [bacterium]HPR88913.1 endolytic transglycosylase MltG [bacterium]